MTTPGPWKVGAAADAILKCANHDPPFTLDNETEYGAAVFLARVAPALLAALEAIATRRHELRDDLRDYDACCEAPYDIADAAIAQAKENADE